MISTAHVKHSQEAAELLGRHIRLARLQRRMPELTLADQAELSCWDLRRIEDGDPTVPLGQAFLVASLAGVKLFDTEPQKYGARRGEIDREIAMLPKDPGDPTEFFDDF